AHPRYLHSFPTRRSSDLDRKVRTVRYTTTDRILAGLPPHPSQEVYYAMSARVLAKIGHAADVPQDFLPHQFRFSANNAYPPLPRSEEHTSELQSPCNLVC